jgi:D-alanyl-lipoteichoic acid acyltransferase DltB (MBOAT superfamily)
MLFNSFEYLVFFPVVAAVYFLIPFRYRWAWLLAASYFFYASWNVKYLALILISTLVPYFIGLALARTQTRGRRQALLLLSLCASLGLLFSFKYWNFASESIDAALALLGMDPRAPRLDVLLPVGISFYTFQTLSYTIDLYRGRIPVERHLGRFALYIAFFPQLVAGPIERASRLLPQLRVEHRVDWSRLTSGLQLIAWGLFQKIVIADRLALYVNTIYQNPTAHGGASQLLATYAFAFQIYCDFSGYSDIAVGSARILGYDLTQNFRQPYFATSITDFWRRWHISLSSWLRDYLYIPLGGNRLGVRRTYVNLLITMLLGGLWHGASWNFVVWGALHGALLSVSRATLPMRDRLHARLGLPRWLRDSIRIFITFHLVCLGWIFFRARTLGEALSILSGITSGWGTLFVDASVFLHGALGVGALLVVQIVQARQGSSPSIVGALPIGARWALWYALVFAIVLLGVEGGSQFIYFQF